jgi:hypothetical protein
MARDVEVQEDQQQQQQADADLHQGEYYPPTPKVPLPTNTEILHLGYPYQEHTSDNHDIS